MGNITSVNDVVLSYGYKKEDFIGKSILEFVPSVLEKQRTIFDKHFASVMSGKIAQGEMEFSTPKGRLTMWFRASPMKKRKEIVGFQIILIDITERKKAEEALRESERKLRDIIDTSPDSIVWVDTTGKITLVNKKGFEITGFSEKDLVGKDFMDVEGLTQESKEKILESFMKRIEGTDTPPYEVGLVTKNGEVLPFELSASPIFEGDKIVGVQAVFRDLRERKRAEDKLRESEEKFRNLFKNIQEPVSIYVGKEGHLIEYNEAFKKMFGYTDEELKGKSLLDFAHPDNRATSLERYRTKYPEEKFPITYETRLVNKKGETIHIEISAGPYKKEGRAIGIEVIHRDITERKKMEEELRESEEKFRNLFESIRDPVGLFVGREGRLLEYNKAFKKMSGYADEELKDKIFLDFVHPDDQAMVLEKYQTKYSEKELPLVYEMRAVNKTGKIIPLEISVSTYRKKGRIIGIEVIHRDITERKKMEEELRESEERLRNLYESVPDALAVYVGREGRLLEYNKAFKKSFRYTNEELKDKIFLDFVHPDDRALVLERYRTEYSEDELPLVYEIRGVNKKGEIFPIEISVGTYKKKGRAIGINVMHRDISERKKAEEALRRSEEETRRLLEFQNKVIDTADVWINLLDAGGNVTLWNRAAELISGYSREEVVGHKKIWEWLYPDPKYRAEILGQAEKVIDEGDRAENDETTISCKDETLKTIRWYDNNILDEKGKPVGSLAVGIDLTEKKAMERKLQEYANHLEDMVEERTKELRESQERLLKSERLAAIGQLATMVGHDLRNPLAAIQNACYYVKTKNETSKDEKLTKMFEIVRKEINYANKIIKDLLEFSSAQKPELTKVDLISSIQDAIAQLRFPENVTLTTKFSEVPTIEADPDQLRRVFQNITLNGAQAMPNGGELTISTRKDDDFVEAAFMDTGVGIPEENMAKLFTPLFTTKAQGVGLGLAICKNLVEGHDGRIEVRSKVGEGSTFTIKLPIHQSKGGEKQT
jgi:PAS domain S-box-containing protein